MLKIRLARGGAKKRPCYSIVVADSHSPATAASSRRSAPTIPCSRRTIPSGSCKLKYSEPGSQGRPAHRPRGPLPVGPGLVKWEHGNNPNKGKPGKKSEERAAERAQRETDRATAAAEAAAAPPPPAPEPEPEVVAEAAPAEVVTEEAAPVEAAAEPAAEEAPVVGNRFRGNAGRG